MNELNLDVVGTHYTLAFEQDNIVSIHRNGNVVSGYTPNALTVALANELFEAREEIEALKIALSENNLIGDTHDI